VAKPAPGSHVCAHLATVGAYPFAVVTVLDDQSGMTDAIIRCRSCGEALLIEMLDWQPPRFDIRTFRTSRINEDVIAQFLHNRDRGSCDVNRAGAEWQAVRAQAQLSDFELTLDVRQSHVVGARHLGADAEIPMGHWRERLR
jgi:hypothetical protein